MVEKYKQPRAKNSISAQIKGVNILTYTNSLFNDWFIALSVWISESNIIMVYPLGTVNFLFTVRVLL